MLETPQAGLPPSAIVGVLVSGFLTGPTHMGSKDMGSVEGTSAPQIAKSMPALREQGHSWPHNSL